MTRDDFRRRADLVREIPLEVVLTSWGAVRAFGGGFGIKIMHDLLLYRSFVTHKPPEEAAK